MRPTLLAPTLTPLLDGERELSWHFENAHLALRFAAILEEEAGLAATIAPDGDDILLVANYQEADADRVIFACYVYRQAYMVRAQLEENLRLEVDPRGR